MMAGILAVVEGSLTDCSEGRSLRPFSAWSVAFGTTTTPQLMAGHLAVPSHFQPSARANDHEAPHEHGVSRPSSLHAARWRAAPGRRRRLRQHTMKGKTTMTKIAALMLAFGLALGAGVSAAQERGEGAEAAGEHRPEGGEGGGEESATQYQLGDTYDAVRAGAHLVLSYDPMRQAFTGTVTNTTNAVLPQVRVEVHLSNGTELGQTTPIDLQPGETVPVMLPATGESFVTWGAHPEVG